MARKDLISISERTIDEQQKITSKGGKASGAARRRKRNMRQCMEMLLSLPSTSASDCATLNAVGITLMDDNEGDINNMLVVNAALLLAAKSGDVQAIKELRSIIRDDERLKIERERLKLEKERKSGTTDDGKLAELVEGLKNDIHE